MAAAAQQEPSTILIVEDHADIRDGLATLLHMRGYTVVTAADGEEALHMLRTGPRPRLILLDLMMPKLDGFGFRRAQLQIPHCADIPVIVLSGTYDARTQAAAIGASGALQKPVNVEQMFALIERHCRR